MMKSVAVIAVGFLIAAIGASFDLVMFLGIAAMFAGLTSLMIGGFGTADEKQITTKNEVFS